jgi:hypothetical protein
MCPALSEVPGTFYVKKSWNARGILRSGAIEHTCASRSLFPVIYSIFGTSLKKKASQEKLSPSNNI